MEKSHSPPEEAPPSPGNALRAGFASFDAASFLERQNKEKERKAADLLAAANAICPSSSDEDSSCSSSADSEAGSLHDKEEHQEEAVSEEGELVGQKRKANKIKPNSEEEEQRHSKQKKKRKKKHAKKSKEEKRRKQHDKDSLSRKERRHREKKKAEQAEAEFAKQVAAELAAGEASRKSTLHPFSTTTTTTTIHTSFAQQREEQQQVFFLEEKQPDPGNIAFGKLYRFDVPQYRRHDPTGDISYLMKASKRGQGTGDVLGLSKSKKGGKEQGGRKEVTMWWRPQRKPESGISASLFASGYVPLDSSKEAPGDLGKDEVLLLTPEEYLLQKTREFNVALRQHPENLELWLDFATFQDEAMEISNSSSTTRGRNNKKQRGGAVRATAEKQISILERGLEHHTGSDVLLLALLDAASKICDHEEMEARWQRVLAYCPASVSLWEAYLMKKRENFAVFKAGEVTTAHYQALSALKIEKERLLVEQPKLHSFEQSLAKLDDSLVEIILLAMSFQLQTGYSELGIAAVRAVLEFNWFAAEGWPEDALEMMFEEFYKNYHSNRERASTSGGGLKMLGDSGAGGWGAWISGENSFEDTSYSIDKKEEEKDEPGGWVEVAPRREETGNGKAAAAATSTTLVSPWEELAPAIQLRFGHALKTGQPEETETLEEEELAQKEEEEEEEEEETDAQLLARLGMDLDAVLADAEEDLTPEVLFTWLDMEYQRDSQQWEALKIVNLADKEILGNEAKDEEEEAEQDENPFNRVTWEDLSPFILSIQNKHSRENLLAGCLQLLGVSLSPCLSPRRSLAESEDQLAVAASWLGIGGNSLEAIDPSASKYGRIEDSEWGWINSHAVLGHAVREKPWWAVTKERHSFVLNILRSLLKVERLKDNYELAFATLNLASWSISSSVTTENEQQQQQQQPERAWGAGRALAKQLLSEQRENLVLYAAFAALEKLSGRSKAAKKVYSACLSGLPQQQQSMDVAAALPAGLIELVLGLSQLELDDSIKPTSSVNSFFPISLSLLRAAPEAVQAAARHFLFLGSRDKTSFAADASTSDATATMKITQEEIVIARRGYQDIVLRLLRAGPEGFDTAQQAAELVSVAAAAELVFAACRDDVGGGVTAALALYKQVIDAISVSSRSTFLERIEIQRCALTVDAAVHVVHVVPPTLAREILSNALQRYPSSPPLLRMLRSLEVNAHALTALRRQLNSLLSAAPSVPAWLMLIGVEIGANAARTAIRAAFLRAVRTSTTNSTTATSASSPLVWRCFLRFERAFGTPDSLHRTFLRAVESCPWSKALWHDGLKLLNGVSSSKELSEYLSIIKEKELAVRTDVLEAVLKGL